MFCNECSCCCFVYVTVSRRSVFQTPHEGRRIVPFAFYILHGSWWLDCTARIRRVDVKALPAAATAGQQITLTGRRNADKFVAQRNGRSSFAPELIGREQITNATPVCWCLLRRRYRWPRAINGSTTISCRCQTAIPVVEPQKNYETSPSVCA